MEKVEYLGHPNCYKLTNDTVQVIVTTDIGPRILRYSFLDGENILAEIPDQKMDTALGEWKPWGGHRLWAAPEVMPRTYAPDNGPIQFRILSDLSIELTAPIEPGTGLQKQMTVTLDDTGSGVTIHHQITNHNQWAIEFAPWGLTIMRGGGVTIIPQEPFRSHDDYLLPARPLTLWYFTNLADPRWTLGPKYIRLRTDESMEDPQKIGVANKQEWMAYHRNGTLFAKCFAYVDGAHYPDEGANCETYTAASFMEIETLAPLHHVEPGEFAEHIEAWSLHANIDIGDTEETLDAAMQKIVG